MIGLPFARAAKRPKLRQRLLDSDDLQEIIDKERSRCDRNGSQFCLVKLELRDTEQTAHQLAEIEKVLHHRLRKTDEVGMILPAVFGIVLMDTPAWGAWKVVDDLIELLPLSVDPPHCSVYCYPSDPHADSQRRNFSQDQSVSVPERKAQPLERLLCQSMPAWKRGMDILGAGLGLLILFPVFVAVSVLVKFTSPGPIFFRQERSGLAGVPFQMLKFRSMRNGAHLEQFSLRGLNEQDGPAFKLSRDPRVTWIGRIIRRTCIDELPQLCNVLKGEMSLVGPRPLPCEESNACQSWQKRRLDVTPGLTCFWQVSPRSEVLFVDWMRMDLRYIRERSLLGDFWLIARTMKVVVLGSGK